MARPSLVSEDEQINMRLRNEAGETIRSIAEDYELPYWRVREICRSEEERKRIAETKRIYDNKRRRYHSAAAARKLRQELKMRYRKLTGHDLLADLEADDKCPSLRNS